MANPMTTAIGILLAPLIVLGVIFAVLVLCGWWWKFVHSTLYHRLLLVFFYTYGALVFVAALLVPAYFILRANGMEFGDIGYALTGK